jgi:hypothetical protein
MSLGHCPTQVTEANMAIEARALIPQAGHVGAESQVRTINFRLGMTYVGWARCLPRAAVLMAFAAGLLLPVGVTPARPTSDTQAFDSIYYNALLSGRDADAALRKAHYLTGSLMQHFGMTRFEAAAEVARIMIMRSGALCSGG